MHTKYVCGQGSTPDPLGQDIQRSSTFFYLKSRFAALKEKVWKGEKGQEKGKNPV